MNATNERTLFEVLNQFWGEGNPDGSIWFIGMEGAAAWPSNSDESSKLKEKYAQRYFADKPGTIKQAAKEMGNRYTKVYDIMSKVIHCLNLKGNEQPSFANKEWLEYRNKKLLNKKGDSFQSNFYPMSKLSRKTWDSELAGLTGYASAKEYEKNVRSMRIEVLKNFYSGRNSKYCICFGKELWNEFKLIFDLVGNDGKEVGNCLVYEKKYGQKNRPMSIFQLQKRDASPTNNRTGKSITRAMIAARICNAFIEPECDSCLRGNAPHTRCFRVK